MATTTLIFENIIIGSYTWTWILLLLIRSGALESEDMIQLLSALKDYPAPLGVAFILAIYPVGSMMNTICYLLARKVFGQHQERGLLKHHSLDFEDGAILEMFVAQHSTEQTYDNILIFRPFLRISRAVVLNALLLTCTLLSFGQVLLPWALLSLGVLVLAIPACLYTYRFKVEETIAAYKALMLPSPESSEAASPPMAREKPVRRTQDPRRG